MKQHRLLLTLLLPLLTALAMPACAQHTRQALLAPKTSDFGLCGCVRQATVVQQYADGNDINFSETYHFDPQGNLTQYCKRGFGGETVTRYPLDGVGPRAVCSYDYDGDLTERRDYDLTGRLATSTHHIYAAGGNLAQTIVYSYHADSGVVKSREVTTYDKKEHPVKVQTFTADELLLMETTMKYDRHGNMTRRTQLFYDDEECEKHVEQRTYIYDDHNNWIRCEVAIDGQKRYTITRDLLLR